MTAQELALYSLARMKLAPEIPLSFRGFSYDFQRDWHLVDVGLYAPVVIGSEELWSGRLRVPAFRRVA